MFGAADAAPGARALVTGPGDTDATTGFGANPALERRALERALERAGGSKIKAAKLLGIGRTTLYVKLAQHGLE